MNAAVRKWLPALAPGLVLLLLGVQVLLGLRGFDQPHGGVLGAMELPGRLLGWGGAALLLPLFVWLLLGWWGYGITGMALKTLGSVALGLAVGGLAALAGGEAAGGRIGGPLAHMLSDSLGSVVAGLVLAVMAVPGALLASARFQLGPAATPTPGAAPPVLSAPKSARPAPGVPGAGAAAPSLKRPASRSGDRARGWYPQRRFDAEGNELPMDFGGAKDVGSIRYRDAGDSGQPGAARGGAPTGAQAGGEQPAEGGEAPDESAEGPATQAPSDVDAASGWPKGLVVPPEEEAPEPEPLERAAPPSPARTPAASPPRDRTPSAADRLRPQARPSRPADRPAPEAPEAPKKVFARSLFPKNAGDNVLLPGVRYKDEPEPAAVPEPPAPPPAASVPPPPPPPAPKPAAPPPAPVREPPAPAPRPAPRPAPAAAAAPAAPAAAPVPTPAPRPAPAPPPAARPAAPPKPSALPSRLAAPDPAAASVTDQPFGPPLNPHVREQPPPSLKESVARALEPLSDQASNAEYRSKLEASGIFAETPPAPRPKAKPAARSAPPPPEPAPAPPPAEEPETPEAPEAPEAREEAPTPPPPPARKAAAPAPPAAKPAPAKAAGAWVQELSDATFAKAVEASLERGAASAVLLTRRLGIGYGKAQALVARLAETGVLGEVEPNGSRAVLITRADLEAATKGA